MEKKVVRTQGKVVIIFSNLTEDMITIKKAEFFSLDGNFKTFKMGFEHEGTTLKFSFFDEDSKKLDEIAKFYK